jgi:hypothetical protein
MAMSVDDMSGESPALTVDDDSDVVDAATEEKLDNSHADNNLISEEEELRLQQLDKELFQQKLERARDFFRYEFQWYKLLNPIVEEEPLDDDPVDDCDTIESTKTKNQWVLVENGSLGGFFDFVPVQFRVGPWNPFAIVYLTILSYLLLISTVYYLRGIVINLDEISTWKHSIQATAMQYKELLGEYPARTATILVPSPPVATALKVARPKWKQSVLTSVLLRAFAPYDPSDYRPQDKGPAESEPVTVTDLPSQVKDTSTQAATPTMLTRLKDGFKALPFRPTWQWYYFCGTSLWMFYVMYLVLLGGGPGIKAWVTYTIQSWTMLWFRHALVVLAPFSDVAAILSEVVRVPCAISTTMTFAIWNFVVFPYIYFVAYAGEPRKQRNFFKFATNFRLTQIHVFNIIFCVVSNTWAAPKSSDARVVSYIDFYLAAISAFSYLIMYLGVLDRLGIHLYPVFSPRAPTKVVFGTWTLLLLSYYSSFRLWKHVIEQGGQSQGL